MERKQRNLGKKKKKKKRKKKLLVPADAISGVLSRFIISVNQMRSFEADRSERPASFREIIVRGRQRSAAGTNGPAGGAAVEVTPIRRTGEKSQRSGTHRG